jgi:hypothetical protein
MAHEMLYTYLRIKLLFTGLLPVNHTYDYLSILIVILSKSLNMLPL